LKLLNKILFFIANLLVVTLAPMNSVVAEEDETTRTRRQLSAVKTEIMSLQFNLQSFQLEKNVVQDSLRQSEIAIGIVQKSISQTRRRLKNNKKQLKILKSKRSKLAKARESQQKLIERQIQTAYQMSRQSQIKILLNQQDPHTVARAMEYYQYFNQARNERIDAYIEIIKKIDTIEPKISSATEALQQSKNELDTQLRQLNKNQNQRKTVLVKLNLTIRSSDQKLKNLNKNRIELEALLAIVEQAVANLEIPDDYKPFAASKGGMDWPVKGKPGNHFGYLRSGGPLKWQGVMITAPEGSPVHAIHHGRVVYADWFRGSGLLIIIDHGHGYMSLYAHNQSLHREVGEWVTADELISTVGNSGGQKKSALYFEIRQQGKPTDPGKWCRNT
jgi:septal ring factor EnvC (AmiA/AmiB activator)